MRNTIQLPSTLTLAFLLASIVLAKAQSRQSQSPASSGSQSLPQPPAEKIAPLSGYVFRDDNHNGIRDKNEPGIEGVAVSDQVNVVRTDAKGFYQFEAPAGYGIVFISLPDGFTAPGNPAAPGGFWKNRPEAGNGTPLDFPLTAAVKHPAFTFIQASDTHISEASIDRMQKFRAIVDSVKPD